MKFGIMHPALEVPDLVYLICCYTDDQDAISLALTCRHLFQLAMPSAWERVKGVPQLFRLLRQGTVSEELDPKDDRTITKIIFPAPLKPEHFDRWNIYAPFVRHLDISEDASQRFDIPNFAALLIYSKKRELLPNLTSLYLHATQPRNLAYLFWISVFGCRSLLDVQPLYQSTMPTISNERESSLMHAIVKRCPNLQTLGFFSYPDSGTTDNDLDKTFLRQTAPLHTFLSHAKALTKLVGSVSFLQPESLEVLGRLPHLKSLEIHYPPKWDDLVVLKKISLPSTAFPKLNSIVLNKATRGGFEFMWQMPTMVSELKTVEIKLRPPRRVDNDWMLQELIPVMCKHSPGVTELLIDFDADAREGIGMPHMCSFTDEAFDAISKLPLTRLEVLHARLEGEDAVLRLARSWPAMEVLRWTAQHVKLQELQQFAEQLPQLKHLALEVNMEPLPEGIDMRRVARIKRRAMRILESGLHKFSDFNGKEASKIYWYLLVMWPNARLETRSSQIDTLPGRKLDLFCLNVVNNMEPLVLDLQAMMQLPADNFSNGIYDHAVQDYVRVMWETGCKFMRPQMESINAPWRMLPAEALPS